MRTWVTSYPIDLIKAIFAVKGPDLIEDIQREEDKSSLERLLKLNLFSYINPARLDKKRILDYGCGSGTSTMVLTRIFPKSEIVGIDIIPTFLSIAEHRKKYYDIKNCNFLLTLKKKLPPNLGKFDLIILSAVYEHLLPQERESLLYQMMKILNPQGLILIFDTPNRYFPIEHHTTGLPFINYLPDRITEILAHRWSKRIDPNSSWKFLLRCGIRGTTAREILCLLKKMFPRQFIYLKPNRLGIRNHVDLWYIINRQHIHSMLPRILLHIFGIFIKWLNNLSGLFLGHSISFVIKKVK